MVDLNQGTVRLYEKMYSGLRIPNNTPLVDPQTRSPKHRRSVSLNNFAGTDGTSSN